MTDSVYGISFVGSGHIPKLDSSDATQLCEYTKNHRIVYFNKVIFVVFEVGIIKQANWQFNLRAISEHIQAFL